MKKMTLETAYQDTLELDNGVKIVCLKSRDESRCYVAISQAARMLGVCPSNAARNFRLMLEDYHNFYRRQGLKPGTRKRLNFQQVHSDLNSKPVNVLSLADFEVICLKLAAAGNKAAQGIVANPAVIWD